MMTRKQLRVLVLDLLLMISISLAVVFSGIWISTGREKMRLQNYYKSVFEDVLSADHYEPVDKSNITDVKQIEAFYEGYDSDNQLVGYVADVIVPVNENNFHVYIGVSGDGSKLTGIKPVDEEGNVVLFTDTEFSVLKHQLIGQQIPIALSSKAYTSSDVNSEYDSVSGLNDGVFFAQTMTADSKGYIDFVEIEVQEGRIVRVLWDGNNLDPTTGTRSNASLTGAYVISGETWATQSYNVCHALIELQEVSRLAVKSDGTTDIIDGVTTDISKFVKLANECVMNSRQNFDKEAYMEVLSTLIEDNSDQTAEELINDDGYIVFSFDDYEIFEVEDSFGNIYVRNVYEMTIEDFVPSNVSSEGDFSSVSVGGDEPMSFSNPNEDGYSSNGDYIVSDSVDGIPLTEIRTYVLGIAGSNDRTVYVITAVNATYKFLKEYLNWVA